MSEIQRRDAHASDVSAPSDVDRDAKIEQLLLVGLDHYFVGEYEQAINVWTRALFVDRNHPRARAYIERARTAVAERQRQSEELLHAGVDAARRGEGEEARRLLQAAIDGGAPSDEALAVLARLNRDAPSGSADAIGIPDIVPRPRSETPLRRERVKPPRSIRGDLIAVVTVVVIAIALGVYVVATGRVDWHSLWALVSMTEPPVAPGAPIVQDLSLPLPRRGEMALARARALAVSGRLHDALAALDQVRATDPQKDDADRLRADLQRQLLALTPMPAAAPAPTGAARERPDRRLP